MSEKKKISNFSNLCNIFGLRPRVPVETIVTTREKEYFHASAMGLWIQSSFLVLKAYKTSKTLTLIKKTGTCVINFTYDIRAFVVAALKKTLSNFNLDIITLGESHARLADAIAWIKAQKISMTDKETYVEITLKLLNGEINSNCYYAWCRSDFLILEALIKATRLPVYRGTKKEKILKDEILRISQECLRITANAEREKSIFEVILAEL
ncbi:MAG: DUF447 domain-containing protein [Candidatus Hodarchaeota archaeon]